MLTTFKSLYEEMVSKFSGISVQPPSARISELIGIEYLFDQDNPAFERNYIDRNLEDGIEDEEDNIDNNNTDGVMFLIFSL